MTTIAVRLALPAGSVDLYLPAVPRVGEHVHYKGENWEVQRVIHTVSSDPVHVRVVLGK